jgi:hypothetical protein
VVFPPTSGALDLHPRTGGKGLDVTPYGNLAAILAACAGVKTA